MIWRQYVTITAGLTGLLQFGILLLKSLHFLSKQLGPSDPDCCWGGFRKRKTSSEQMMGDFFVIYLLIDSRYIFKKGFWHCVAIPAIFVWTGSNTQKKTSSVVLKCPILYKYPDVFHDSLDHQNTGSVFSNSIKALKQNNKNPATKSPLRNSW